jgi:hypothetical protein
LTYVHSGGTAQDTEYAARIYDHYGADLAGNSDTKRARAINNMGYIIMWSRKLYEAYPDIYTREIGKYLIL